MAQWSDEELLAAIRQESEDAFAQLVINYMPMIQRLATRFRKTLVDSEDLAQEGLLGLLSAARHYESGSVEFPAFAYVCIRRRMLSAVRKASRPQEGAWFPQENEDEKRTEGTRPPPRQGQSSAHVLIL